MNSAKPDYIENIFGLMKLVSGESVIKKFEDDYNNCVIRYGDMKKTTGRRYGEFYCTDSG